jgi:hypothetical protein
MSKQVDNEPLAPRENDPALLKFLGQGWLKNGNPPGDLRNATRCHARSKRTGEPCRQPAMTNGCCRLHGGKSTGPRTPEGLERSRQANWKHGKYSRESKEEWRAFRQGMRLLLNPQAIFKMTPAERATHKAALDRLRDKQQRGLFTIYHSVPAPQEGKENSHK